MTEAIDITEDEELDEPELYEWEDEQGYPLGCPCACECCGCVGICEESQIDEDIDYEEEDE